jgi:hypothetical protein
MTAPRPARYRVNLSTWCVSVLRRCYPGQVPATVMERALRMLAQADGHLDTGGRIKQGRRP